METTIIHVCYTFLLLCGSFPIFTFGQSLGMPDCELKLVQVIYRHGDRNPIDPYPNDPYKNESFWPEGYGQLTKIGKMQQYELGQYLRNRYSDFLNKIYSPYEIYISSSSQDRTLMSAESNLAGLYPPQDERSKWNDQILWQPIPVHSKPESIDNTLKMKAPCPQYEKLYNEFLESEIMKKINDENVELYQILSNYSGINITNPDELEFLMDALHIENIYNFTLPNWTHEIFPKYKEKLKYLSAFSFQMMTYTQEMKKLKAGPLIGEILENMKNKSIDVMDKRRKFFMYSAHDTTVSAFLNSLDIFYLDSPPYAALIMIELHFNLTSKEYFVEILYRNNTKVDPYILRLPGCGIPCTLDAFSQLTKSIIPIDWKKECQLALPTYDMIGIAVGALVLGLTLGLFLCLSMLVMSYLKNKRAGPKPPAYPYLHLQMEDGDNEDA